MTLLLLVLAYAATGAILAVAFFLSGLSPVRPHVSLTLGARLILLPGIVALWPLVLGRWLNMRRRP